MQFGRLKFNLLLARRLWGGTLTWNRPWVRECSWRNKWGGTSLSALVYGILSSIIQLLSISQKTGRSRGYWYISLREMGRRRDMIPRYEKREESLILGYFLSNSISEENLCPGLRSVCSTSRYSSSSLEFSLTILISESESWFSEEYLTSSSWSSLSLIAFGFDFSVTLTLKQLTYNTHKSLTTPYHQPPVRIAHIWFSYLQFTRHS